MTDVPLTLLGGYLGSGKTTLVNALLRDASRRIAVLVNDFGAVNIDADLIRRRGATTLELANGCVCCSLVDGMASAMVALAGLDPRPEYAVVELSGVADPSAMATWGRYPGFTPGGVLVCADAETVRTRAADKFVGDTVTHQLATADLLLLTKTDLTGERQAESVRAWLSRTAPGVPVADAAPELLLDPPLDTAPGPVGSGPAPDSGGSGPAHAARGAAASGLAPASAMPGSAGHGPHAVHHAWAGESAVPVDRGALEAALDALDAGVVRVKGVVRLAGAPDRRTVVQVVGRRRELTDDGPWPDPAVPSRLVAIAVHADAAADAARRLSRSSPAGPALTRTRTPPSAPGPAPPA